MVYIFLCVHLSTLFLLYFLQFMKSGKKSDSCNAILIYINCVLVSQWKPLTLWKFSNTSISKNLVHCFNIAFHTNFKVSQIFRGSKARIIWGMIWKDLFWMEWNDHFVSFKNPSGVHGHFWRIWAIQHNMLVSSFTALKGRNSG